MIRILFLGTGNSCRSQMAEGWAKHLKGDAIEPYSAGIEFDYVITVCGHANENCPVFPGRATIIHVGFDDPPKLAEAAGTEEERLGP